MIPDTSHIVSKILHKVETEGIIAPNEKIVIGVSGGSDSTALLLTLTELPYSLELIAVYVDHGLRPEETPAEIEFISSLCRTLSVLFLVKTVDVRTFSKQNKSSLEDSARQLRYKALEEVRQKYDYDKIGVAHNLDDQVEEFFIRLLRGSGARGLSGMRPQRDRLIRPLLDIPKKDLQKYLREKHISWCTDSSNSDRTYLRNRVRLDLLPELEKNYNPSIRRTVLQNMAILREEDHLLSSLADTAFSSCVKVYQKSPGSTKELRIVLLQFSECHRAVRNRIVEKCCWQMGVRPSFATISEIESLAIAGENGKELHLPKRLRVVRTRETLGFTMLKQAAHKRASISASAAYLIPITGPGKFTVPQTEFTVEISLTSPPSNLQENSLTVDLDKCPLPLELRGFMAGTRFTPSRGVGSRKVARYFNDIKLDKHKRAPWPILYHDGQVVAIVGHDIDRSYMVDEHTEKLLVIRLLSQKEK